MELILALLVSCQRIPKPLSRFEGSAQTRGYKSEVLAYWIAKQSLTNALHFLLLYPFSKINLRRSIYPSRHGMVSPNRLSVRKDWPEYKNIISEHGSKNNPSMFPRVC